MRPSRMRRCIDSRAISRRTGSKPERTTALGVSSMRTVTPVAASKARMLRPRSEEHTSELQSRVDLVCRLLLEKKKKKEKKQKKEKQKKKHKENKNNKAGKQTKNHKTRKKTNTSNRENKTLTKIVLRQHVRCA